MNSSRKPVQIGAAAVYHGDCIAIAPTLSQVDAIVCDPPYHLVSAHERAGGSLRSNQPISRMLKGFMGQAWDGGDIAFRPETWATIGTALKPGGYLLAFGGTRTHHRIWSAIDDAGFVIQDTIMWLYGQGFPKGRTQLKPAFEPICVAYKPSGKRTLQVDECRIPAEDGLSVLKSFNKGSQGGNIGWDRPWNTTGEKYSEKPNTKGRWPANVCHDGSDEVTEAFAAFGTKTSNSTGSGATLHGVGYGGGARGKPTGQYAHNTGTAARFFYSAKASKADRVGSKHPTVKPVALMRWLVRLVTPPGGLVLDPFAGSGTTAAAALAEGRRVILIEREVEYIVDIKRRLKTLQQITKAAA